MSTSNYFLWCCLLQLLMISCVNKVDNSLKYYKQEPPSLTPEIFAPGIISIDGRFEFGSVFSKDGTEFFFGVDTLGKAETRFSKLVGDQWTTPKTIISHDSFSRNDPFLSPNEQELYFISNQLENEEDTLNDINIWYVKKEQTGWSAPVNVGPNINSDKNEYYISFTDEGTMYFASNTAAKDIWDTNFDIYRSERINGVYQTPTKVSEAINTKSYEADVFIAPDESYIIFCSFRKEGLGQGDLYISFKNEDGTWTRAKNMGEPINTVFHEFCPFVTRDGKYLLYTSNKDIYWVDASIIEQYR